MHKKRKKDIIKMLTHSFMPSNILYRYLFKLLNIRKNYKAIFILWKMNIKIKKVYKRG